MMCHDDQKDQRQYFPRTLSHLLSVSCRILHVNQHLSHSCTDGLDSEHSLLHHNVTNRLDTFGETEGTVHENVLTDTNGTAGVMVLNCNLLDKTQFGCKMYIYPSWFSCSAQHNTAAFVSLLQSGCKCVRMCVPGP